MPPSIPASTQVVVRLITDDELPRWRCLLHVGHYLGGAPAIGRCLRYVAHLRGSPAQWLGIMSWGEAALRYEARDRWIGWSALQQRHRRDRVILNHRFLVLPGSPVRHVGSQILSLAVRRVADDWEFMHGVRPLLAETFVDTSRFVGSVYRAAGWNAIGSTAGYARSHRMRHYHGKRKTALVHPLAPQAREQLRAPVLGSSPGRILLGLPELDALAGVIAHLPDPRAQRGRSANSWHGLWTALAAADLAGMPAASDLPAFLRTIPREHWRRLGCRGSLQSATPILPSPATCRRARAAFHAAGGTTIVAAFVATLLPIHTRAA
jgi:Domain of unknown function (DUF4338)